MFLLQGSYAQSNAIGIGLQEYGFYMPDRYIVYLPASKALDS